MRSHGEDDDAAMHASGELVPERTARSPRPIRMMLTNNASVTTRTQVAVC